jgi:transposase
MFNEAVLTISIDQLIPDSIQHLINGLVLRIQELENEVAALRKENALLRKENTLLRKENDLLKEQVSTLKGALYGKKSEKGNQNSQDSSDSAGNEEQKSCEDSEPNIEQEKVDQGEKKKRGKGGHRDRRNHSHLPVVEVKCDLGEDEKYCPCCKAPYEAIEDYVEGDTIEIEVKAYKRRVRRKKYIRPCKCTDLPKFFTAPSPGKIIPKGSIGNSVWTEILLSKFLFFTPTNRLLKDLELSGIFLPPSTIIDGMKKIKALLKPCYDHICDRNKTGERWHVDETRWLVYEKTEGKNSVNWFIWTFNSPDTIVYRLSKFRSAEVIKNHLGEEIDGILSCDRYTAYKKYANETKGGIDLAFCWAHVRRDFIRLGKAYPEHKEWSRQIVEVEIRELYYLHSKRKAAFLDEQSSSELLAELDISFRQKMKAFIDKRKEELDSLTLADCQRKVNESLMDHWHGLTVVIASPETDMDNNAAERALRGPVVARKNFWGSVMEWSGELAVMAFTLTQTLQLWGINPKAWLNMFFEACARNKGQAPSDISIYLPWNMSIETFSRLSVHDHKMSTDPP